VVRHRFGPIRQKSLRKRDIWGEGGLVFGVGNFCGCLFCGKAQKTGKKSSTKKPYFNLSFSPSEKRKK
jgi:hypothetical protein